MTELSALWDFPDPHTLYTVVMPQDMDALNHTNNTVYVKWCEQVAWYHSVSLGLDMERYRELDRAMAITHSEYDYLQASREGDVIVAGTWIVSSNNKLTTARSFQVTRLQDDVTLLRAAMRFVCIEISRGGCRGRFWRVMGRRF